MTDLSMREPLTRADDDFQETRTTLFSQRLRMSCCCGKKLKFALQVLHCLISIFFLLAGVAEFVSHPPYFDAYGDADTDIDSLPELFKNDPRSTESELLRLVDLPILVVLVMYQAVCIWLKYKGLSWIMTLSLILTFICFWIVNFGKIALFEWSYYSKRMNGLQLQVSTIALSGTMVFMVIFQTRKKLPFKFKSSLRIKQNSKFYICWNFFAIYLVMFTAMMVWFIKMYASWALFASRTEILRLCSTTDQVECYPCQNFTKASLRHCAHVHRHRIFTCSQNFPDLAEQGAFCIFNFNMSIYGFLLTFAYIGGISVFMSTFLRVVGHYTVRGLVFVYETILSLHYHSSGLISKQRDSLRNRRQKHRKTRATAADNNANVATEPTEVYSSDSDDNGNGLINSLIFELP